MMDWKCRQRMEGRERCQMLLWI